MADLFEASHHAVVGSKIVDLVDDVLAEFRFLLAQRSHERRQLLVLKLADRVIAECNRTNLSKDKSLVCKARGFRGFKKLTSVAQTLLKLMLRRASLELLVCLLGRLQLFCAQLFKPFFIAVLHIGHQKHFLLVFF